MNKIVPEKIIPEKIIPESIINCCIDCEHSIYNIFRAENTYDCEHPKMMKGWGGKEIDGDVQENGFPAWCPWDDVPEVET